MHFFGFYAGVMSHLVHSNFELFCHIAVTVLYRITALTVIRGFSAKTRVLKTPFTSTFMSQSQCLNKDLEHCTRLNFTRLSEKHGGALIRGEALIRSNTVC